MSPSASFALGPWSALRASLTLLGRSPWQALSLGLALYASLLAVCCGLGVLVAPWFMCELWAVLIANGTGEAVPRTRAWLWAGAVQAVAVLLSWSVALLALSVLAPDLFMGGAPGPSEDTLGVAVRALGVMAVTGALVLGVTVHAQYAPAILIERGGHVLPVLLESARVVSAASAFRTWLTSGTAHALQVGLPLTAVVWLTTHASPASIALYALLILPLSVVCLVVGQGMVVASYLNVRPQVKSGAQLARPALTTQSGMSLWAVLLLCTLSGPVAASFVLLKPAEAEPGRLPSASEVLLQLRTADAESSQGAQQRFVPDTALTIRLAAGQASVVASDGGGAGAIPVPGTVSRLKVVRADGAPGWGPQERTFAIELTLDDGRVFTTKVDEAGVRLDDSIERRVSSRLHLGPALVLLAALLWTALWVAYALPLQARALGDLLQRWPSDASATGSQPEPTASTSALAPSLPANISPLKRALRRKAFVSSLWLVPATAASLWVALAVLLR